MRRTRALIAGGGPAGSAAAIRLAAAGLTPLLIERTREPADPLCGGFLSWRTAAALRTLGIDVMTLRAAPVSTLRLFAGGRVAEAALPGRAWGLSRRTLDAALIERAVTAGAGVERGVAVRAADGRTLRLDDGGVMTSEALLLATGKHELRGLARPKACDPAIGLRVRLAEGAAPGGTIELHAFDRGYAGVVAQEAGGNLCLAVARSRLTDAGGDPAALLAALGRENSVLGERLARAEPPIDAVAGVPYGWRATMTEAGVYRLGDQAAVIPSLAGEGIGIAIASGIAAAEAIAAGEPAEAWQPRFARRTAHPVRVAGVVRSVAEGPARGLLPLLAGASPALVRTVAALTRVRD